MMDGPAPRPAGSTRPPRVTGYDVHGEIGRGGMGVVYRARDIKLDREVAIKALPPEVALDPERLQRFEREAKALAQLNHPNVAAIHGLTEVDGAQYIILEYVPGDTLEDVLARGPMPVSEALRVARQIADAIEAAHAKGIIHRDLKPANIKFGHDDVVKVLDFGLAKAFDDNPISAENLATSPTYVPTNTPTMPGVVMGTAGYLSPEQARGRPVDKRSDIWAFGCLLHEMLTGRQLFGGETVTDALGATLHKQPDWDALPADVPVNIRLLLRRCLAKDRKRRLHDIADARLEIDDAINDPTGAALGLGVAAPDAAPTRSRLGPAVVAVVALLAGAAIVGGLARAMWPAPEAPRPTRRFAFAHGIEARSPRISPDGTMVAFIAERELRVRALDGLEERAVVTDRDRGIRDVFWSPDSTAIGFVDREGLWRVDASGGRPIELAAGRDFATPTWTDDDRIVYAAMADGGLMAVPARGGSPRRFVEPLADEEMHLHGGGALPGGRGVLFVQHRLDDEPWPICLATPDGERRVLYRPDANANAAWYSATGHIMFERIKEPRGIWALPFALDETAVTGEPFLVLPDVSTASFSSTGDLVYATNVPSAGERMQLTWVDRAGTVLETVGTPLYGAIWFALSPDGRTAAVIAHGLDGMGDEDERQVWICDLVRGTAARLTDEEGLKIMPAWSPEGDRVIYALPVGGRPVLHARAADGSGTSEVLLDGAISLSSAVGSSLAALTAGSFAEGFHIETMTMGDPSTRTTFQDGPDDDAAPAVRPGGRLVAYLSGRMMESDWQLFLRRFPDGPGRWQVSAERAEAPVWSADGDRLYYMVENDGSETTGSRNKTLMEVSVELDGDDVRLGRPVRLFEAEWFSPSYHVAPDGERFLVLVPAEAGGAADTDDDPAGTADEDRAIVIVENWFEEHRER